MKNKLFICLIALITAFCCISAACAVETSGSGNDGEVIDYGTLTIKNISVIQGETAKISYTFSIAERAEEITYAFDGNAIEIKDGKVKALVGDETVTVTATTEHHEAVFTVTTYSVDYGTISIDDLYAWVDYPASEIDVSFEYPEYEEQLVYTYDKTKLEINAATNTVKALSEGNFEVTAQRPSDGFTTTFTVRAEKVNRSSEYYNTSNYKTKVANYKTYWEQNGKSRSTTLFIGDSFFDSSYWSDFYTTYAGKDAIRSGVGSSTTCDWEIFADTYLKYTDPKNIVMHIGTNNVYNDRMEEEETFKALQRMFYVIHDRVPSAKIYYFNISQRSYDPVKQAIVSDVNAKMKDWCEKRDWITLIDTSSLLTADMLRDNTHPKLEYYSVFINALNKTDIVINDLID